MKIMTKYTLVSDKLYRILDYYIDKAKECKDFLEWHTLIGWYLVEATEVVSKSGLDNSAKKQLLIWTNSEISVLYSIYKLYSKD